MYRHDNLLTMKPTLFSVIQKIAKETPKKINPNKAHTLKICRLLGIKNIQVRRNPWN